MDTHENLEQVEHEDRDWVGTGEAATILGVSRKTVTRYRDSGILPYYRVGGPLSNIRIKRADVEELARGRRPAA